jgi:hypothetical protein
MLSIVPRFITWNSASSLSRSHMMLSCMLVLHRIFVRNITCCMSSLPISTHRTLNSCWVFKAKQSSTATCHGGAWGERRYSSYSFLTLALDGGEWSASRSGHALPWGKDPRYPLYRRLGGPQSQSGHRDYRKNPLPLPGIEPRSPGP